MGAWSHDIFGNDDACDWAAMLLESNSIAFVDKTLDRVLEVDGQYLESPDAALGLAAAEVVASLLGHPGEKSAYTQKLDEWQASQAGKPSAQLIQKAQAAAARVIAEPCELMELWQDTDDFETWKATVLDLQSRLKP